MAILHRFRYHALLAIKHTWLGKMWFDFICISTLSIWNSCYIKPPCAIGAVGALATKPWQLPKLVVEMAEAAPHVTRLIVRPMARHHIAHAYSGPQVLFAHFPCGRIELSYNNYHDE